MTRWAVAITLVVGCGRIGFDPGEPDAHVEPLPAPELASVIQLDVAGNQAVHALAATGNDGVVAGGDTDAPADFGGGLLPAFGLEDGWIASFDVGGKHRWSRAFGSAGEDKVFTLTTDDDGNVYVAGRAGGPIDFGGGVLTFGGGASDIFIASYDPDGAHRWSRMYGTAGVGEIGFGLAFRAGRIYMTGWFENTITFDDGARASADGQDVFVAAFDPDGVVQRSWRFGGMGLDQGQKIAIDAAGDVVIAGLFVDSIDFGAGPVPAVDSHDAFVVRFAPDGAVRWSKVSGAGGSDQAIGVSSGPAGEAYATGILSTSIDFGLGPLVATAGEDGYVVAFDAAGQPRWNYTLAGNDDDDKLHEARVGPDGVLVVTGWFTGAASLAGTALAPRGVTDCVLAGFAPDGTHVWSRVFGGPGAERAVALDLAPDGSIWIGGERSGTADFGDGAVRTAVGIDAFVLRLTR